MSGPLVVLDFAAPRARTPALSIALLLVGVSLAGIAALQYRSEKLTQQGLELKLAALTHRSVPDPENLARSARDSAEAASVTRQLATPWTAVLSDLESASQDEKDRIALLSVEPDSDKHLIHVTGESRDLPAALAYLERLQTRKSLRYPMLISHEVTDASEHPVRFALIADWREPQ